MDASRESLHTKACDSCKIQVLIDECCDKNVEKGLETANKI